MAEHNVLYFRNIISEEGKRLTSLCELWNSKRLEIDVSEDVRGQIRTTVGQAQLLMAQRFKQFSGLVDNCEFNIGEKETTCQDLQGFWDMIYFQVEDINKKFELLEKLEGNSWQPLKTPDPSPRKIAKTRKARPAHLKPPVAKSSVRSHILAERQRIAKSKVTHSSSSSGGEEIQAEKENIKVFEMPGFFTVASPLKSPSALRCKSDTCLSPPQEAMKTTPLPSQISRTPTAEKCLRLAAVTKSAKKAQCRQNLSFV